MENIFAFSIALILALTFTPLVRWLSLRFGHVVHPQKDRWHTKPTALHGGVAIFLAYAIPLVLVLPISERNHWVLLLGSGLIFSMGLLDDFLHLKPSSKLVGQVVAACVIVGSGLLIGQSPIPILGIFLTLFWIVGITNAFNLLDNMDGLSAGTAGISAFYLAVAGVLSGNGLMSVMGFSLVGATLGFLFFNFPPAKIFMGDSGSLFLGFTLACLTLTGTWEQATNMFLAMVVPLFVFAVPIFDTTFVSLVRFLNGQPISVGGKDHTAHRLVAFGLPEKTTVLFFYVMSAICGTIALIGAKYNLFVPAILLIVLVIGLWYFGLFLSGIISYGNPSKEPSFDSRNYGLVFTLALKHKKRIGEVIVDCILIGVSFTLAYAIRFEGLPQFYIDIIGESLPILIPLKLMVFFYFGLYRGLWRYVGMHDLINILKAVIASSILSVMIMTMAFRFEGHSRAVFIIDGMILFFAVGGIRVFMRLLKEYLGTLTKQVGKRLLIIGAGDAGEFALREIRNNPSLSYHPIGFIDDDIRKVGRNIHGVPVLGTRGELPKLAQKWKVEEILVAIPSANKEILKKIFQDCRKTNVSVQVMGTTGTILSPMSA